MPVDCPSCGASLPAAWFAGEGGGRCSFCNSSYRVWGFPALLRPPVTLSPQELSLSEGDASCFQHATKKAAAACHQCGRFVCALCRLEAAGAVWCPVCFVPGAASPNPRSAPDVLIHQRTLYDSIALGTAALPLLFGYLAFFTAPAALFVTLRFWRRPSSLIPRGKWRLVAALVLSILEIFGLAASIGLVLYAVLYQGRA